MADDDQVMGIISELPEPIVHHILSFLTTKEATKTSVLSKAWLSAWRTRPTLEFDWNLLTFKELIQRRSQNQMDDLAWITEQKHKMYTKGLQYMRSSLLRYLDQKICLETLNLSIRHDFSEKSLVEECIDLAVENGVKNLDLSIPDYLLPQKVLEAKSLVSLGTKYCVLKEQEIRCYRLKRLNLRRVDINEQVFKNIMSICQLIEDLEITCCKGFANFTVTKLRYLKQFKALLLTNQRVDVEAPCLELLTCGSLNILGTATACCLNLPASQYQYLKSLSLCAVEISVSSFANMAIKFPRLEHLCIQYCRILQRIKISGHSLKTIQLLDNEELEVTQFDVPRIDRFEYTCCYWSKEIMPQFSFNAASSCWASHISIICRNSMDSSWFLKLREFLRRLIPSEISIRITFTQDVPSAVDVTENSVTLPQPQEIKEFWVKFWGKLSLSSVDSVLDNVFWTCHPHTIWHVYHEKFTTLIYDRLMFRKNQSHPNLQNFKKFWRHDLKDVKVDIFEYGKFGNGRILEYVKIGQGVQLPEALDWEEFCKVLNAHEDKRLICFNLEWKNSDIAQ